jgi:glycosyltransferase involved in cell wall biosynthesis
MSVAEATSSPDTQRPLVVVINGVHAKSGGGVTYLRHMLPELAGTAGVDVRLILHESQRNLFEPVPDGVDVVTFDYNPGFLPTLIWEQFSLPGIARRMGADVLFSPANFGPVLARNHVVLLRNATSVIRLTRRFRPLVYWLMLSAATVASLMTARRAITVSNYAARVLTFGFGKLLRKKVSVVYHGTETPEIPHSDGAATENVLLAVSDIYIQKNYHTLILAFAAVRKRNPDLVLTIVGQEIDTHYAASIRDLVRDFDIEDAVQFAGHIETAELAALYRNCRVFVFPSTVETFGNPLLEAMAAGAPIATSRSAAMPEVVGDCGLLFDPDDADDMAARIEELLADPVLCRELGAKAALRAQSFTWEKTARQTLEVLREAAGR